MIDANSMPDISKNNPGSKELETEHVDLPKVASLRVKLSQQYEERRRAE